MVYTAWWEWYTGVIKIYNYIEKLYGVRFMLHNRYYIQKRA